MLRLVEQENLFEKIFPGYFWMSMIDVAGGVSVRMAF